MRTIPDKTILLDNQETLSYNTLFNEMYAGMCLFAERFLIVSADGEDLVQEVFVTLWDKFEDFDALNPIKAYLYQSIRNACLNKIRHERVKRKYEAEQAYQLESESFFHQQVVEEEGKRLIVQCISELPPQCRKVLQLSMLDLKNSEIAEDLGISINSVKTQKAIAYKTLRLKLQSVFDIMMIISGM